MIIAIDGPAGAGKSTVARLLAKRLRFIYLDTGAMYRALTLKALDKNIDVYDEQAVVRMALNTTLDINNSSQGEIQVFLDGEDVSERIRLPEVTRYVSDIAKIKGVRQHMLELQRAIGSANDSVVDGRDIGTVVFPSADKKFYIDAEFTERVKRRFKELRLAGSSITEQAVSADLSNRDSIDSTRQFAPLKKADDAIYVDTTRMNIEQVVSSILKAIKG